MNTYFIRKKDWHEIYFLHQEFFKDLRKKFLFTFYLKINPIIQRHKLKMIKVYKRRADYK